MLTTQNDCKYNRLCMCESVDSCFFMFSHFQIGKFCHLCMNSSVCGTIAYTNTIQILMPTQNLSECLICETASLGHGVNILTIQPGLALGRNYFNSGYCVTRKKQKFKK